MKRIEVKMFIDINENEVTEDDVIFHLDTAIDETIGGVVKRVDLIDSTEL